MSLIDLVNAMGNAGTQDLRGVQVLPYSLKVIGHPSNPALAQAVDELTAWVHSGAHRINRAHPGASGEYEQGAAVQLMDAWWPLLVKAEFGPVLGTRCSDRWSPTSRSTTSRATAPRVSISARRGTSASTG